MALRLMTAWCLGTALIISATTAIGQTRPKAPVSPQPAANPAVQTSPVAPRTSSIGNAREGSPILTRDELRACFAQRDSLNGRAAKVDADRSSLDAQRKELETSADQIKAERAKLDGVRTDADALNQRARAHQVKLDTWNEQMAEIGNSSTPQATHKRRRLETERRDLQESSENLQKDVPVVRAKIEGAVSGFNGLVEVHDKKAQDWNQRNASFVDRANALTTERAEWSSNCSNRRYFEEDETAIKAGK